MEKELFDDLIQSCNEVIEYQKGNIQLKTSIVDVPNEEVVLFNLYSKLTDANKVKVIDYASTLLRA